MAPITSKMSTAPRKKIVIVGDGSVGKSSLLRVISGHEFPKDYLPTYFDNFLANMEVDGKPVELSLWDTAGHEQGICIRPKAYLDSHLVLMCFSISEPKSLKRVWSKWGPELRYYLPETPIILVGTKKDLRRELSTMNELGREKQEIVKSSEGRLMAAQLHALEYFECSSKANEGVRELFDYAVRSIRIEDSKKRRQFCPFL